MLHITNGDNAADLIEAAMEVQYIIPWRDVLYEGPVQAHTSLEAAYQQRAEYLASVEYGEYQPIYESFQERHAILSSVNEFEEVILWFEHDTYDQLQLLEAIHSLHTVGCEVPISLICINSFANVESFRGLGQLTAQDLASLFPKREPLNTQQLQLALKLWQAFCDKNPEKLYALSQQDLSLLPFMKNALLRFFSEYPSTKNGLSWTEQYVLDTLMSGENSEEDIFVNMPSAEGERFLGMGDTTFERVLIGLTDAPQPLITLGEQPDQAVLTIEIEVTPLGKQVATGEKDWLEIKALDCWRGGVHLSQDNIWRWDGSQFLTSSY